MRQVYSPGLFPFFCQCYGRMGSKNMGKISYYDVGIWFRALNRELCEADFPFPLVSKRYYFYLLQLAHSMSSTGLSLYEFGLLLCFFRWSGLLLCSKFCEICVRDLWNSEVTYFIRHSWKNLFYSSFCIPASWCNCNVFLLQGPTFSYKDFILKSAAFNVVPKPSEVSHSKTFYPPFHFRGFQICLSILEPVKF